MTKQILYKYLGTNGIIVSPIYLEGIYCVRQVQLVAQDGKLLTKDNKNFYASITVPEDEADSWREV